MNIWLLRTSEPLPVVDPDGRLMRMGMLAEELSKRGHNVIWFSGTFNHFTKKQLFNEDTIIEVKKNYHLYLSYAKAYKKNISVNRILNYMRIAKKFKKQAKKLEKPDLIYVSYPTIDYADEAVKYGKKNNIPVIVDIRDLWPDIFNHNLSKSKRLIAFPYILWMERKAKKIMKNAFAINGNSEAVLNWGLEKGKRTRSKFDQYFFLGYKSPESNMTNEHSIEMDSNKFNIVFIATINNQFNYSLIAKLAERLETKDKDVLINICGDGPQMEELNSKVKSNSNVKIWGWLGKNDIYYALKKAKIGLAPYKDTFDFQVGVSNKFAEYLSYGLPIILTSEGYMKSLIDNNNCGIASQNIDEICDYIIKLKNNPEEYKKISDNARRLYEKSFIAEKIYKDLVDYLEKIKEETKK